MDLAEKALIETTDPKLQTEIRESIERVKKSREKLMEG